jgi:hypothetical protein
VTSKEPKKECFWKFKWPSSTAKRRHIPSWLKSDKNGHLTCTFTWVTASTSAVIRIPFRAKAAGGEGRGGNKHFMSNTLFSRQPYGSEDNKQNAIQLFYVHVTVLHRNKFLFNKTNQMH